VAYELAQALGLDPAPWNPALKGAYWLFASLGNPVHLANILLAAVWASFAAWPAAVWWAWVPRLGWLAGAFATGERSVWLRVFSGATVAAAAGRERWWRGTGVAALAVLLLAATIAATGHGGRAASGLRLAGARPQIWGGALRLARARPWLGIGP